MPKRRKGARQQIEVVPGRAWHYMRGCRVCGGWAEYLPQHEGRCARHGGRPLDKGERMPRRAESSWSISLPGSTPE